jgi:hypothetical protein
MSLAMLWCVCGGKTAPSILTEKNREIGCIDYTFTVLQSWRVVFFGELTKPADDKKSCSCCQVFFGVEKFEPVAVCHELRVRVAICRTA